MDLISQTLATGPEGGFGAQRVQRNMKIIAGTLLLIWLVVVVSPDPSFFELRSGKLIYYHTAVEAFSIVVSIMVAVLAGHWKNQDRTGHARLLWAGFSLVAVLDTLHVLAWEGMPAVLVPVGAGHGIYYWLWGRALMAAVLICLAYGIGINISRRTWLVGSVIFVVVVSVPPYFSADGWPALFQKGRGVTALKSVLELFIALAYASAALQFWRTARPGNAYRHLPLATACAILAMGELLFTYYVTPSAFSNMIGHVYKVIAYYLIYRAVFVDGIEQPYRALEAAALAIEDQSSQLRSLSDNVPNGLVYVFTRDEDGRPRFLHISRGVQQVHGISAEEALADGSKLWSQIHRDDLPLLAEAEERSRRTMEMVQVRARFLHPSGEWRVMQFSSRPRVDHLGRLIWEGIELDVTTETRIREQLDRERDRLQSIIDSAMDGMISIDTDQRIVIVNEAAVRMFQVPAESLIGQKLDKLLPERFRKAHATHIAHYRDQAHTARPMGQFMRIFGLRADGSEFPIEASIARQGEGAAALYTVVLRDVTAKVKAEARREILEQQLQQSQKVEALGTLAGGIAHDFNNILAIINGNTSLALEEIPAGHPSAVALNEIARAGRRGRDLIQRILTFSRLRQNNPEVLDVAQVVEEARQLLRPTLPAGIRLSIEQDGGPFMVHMDRVALEQVLVNLCTNAWQSMTTPEGHIRIHLRQGLAGREAPQQQAVILEVADNGAGIAPELIGRVFEPFFTTKPVGQGTGLGLAMVHSIVTRAGGRIDLASEQGKGSTFTIVLPASTQEILRPVAAPAHRTESAPLHLLYVDDEQALVFLLQRSLSRQGHRVTAYTDPREAAAAVREGKLDYDVAVLDQNMPHMSGLELASELLRHRPDHKVILTSGFVDDALETEARARGITAVVYKPASIEEMMVLVLDAAGKPPV